MKLPLTKHPKTPITVNNEVSIDFQLTNNKIQLVYSLGNPDNNLLIPPKAKPGKRDELWQRTCCEAFIGIINQPQYLEFNFSPSGEWAAYAFSDYRERIDWENPMSPEIRAGYIDSVLQVEATILLDALPADFKNQRLEIGFTAVLEDKHQHLAYFALAHSQENPDFHRRDRWIRLV